MKLTFIGMSGVGKSYWAEKLQKEAGFIRITCDDLIGERLKEELAALGLGTDLDALAKWFGFPYEQRYKRNQHVHIKIEQAAMEHVCGMLANIGSKNVVIDTSGSLIYLNQTVLNKLKAQTQVIYLRAGEKQIEELLADGVPFKKPLVWGDVFVLRPGESNERALRRCFANLVAWRQERYASLADVTVEHRLSKTAKTTDDFLSLIQ